MPPSFNPLPLNAGLSRRRSRVRVSSFPPFFQRSADRVAPQVTRVLPVESSDTVVITKAQEIDAIPLSLNGDFSPIVSYPCTRLVAVRPGGFFTAQKGHADGSFHRFTGGPRSGRLNTSSRKRLTDEFFTFLPKRFSGV